MRLGVVVLPELRWEHARRQWQQLDEWGYHSAWTYDHLAWRSLADGPWFATVPTLAAAALATTTIRLGTFVASPNFRHPVPFAKELMSLDDLSRRPVPARRRRRRHGVRRDRARRPSR